MNFYDEVAKQIRTNYPELDISDEQLKKIIKITSPHEISLPRSVFTQAEKFIKILFKLRLQSKYISSHWADDKITSFDPGHFSVLMAYDFHVTSDYELKLIEVNTNGASALLVDILYQLKNQWEQSNSFRESLKNSFRTEMLSSTQNIAIVDENYTKQNSYVEFLMFRELFKSWGFQAFVGNPEEFIFDGQNLHLQNTRIDLVYNRLTDFYLQSPNSTPLRNAYLKKCARLTPCPFEYHLLANKLRLKIFSSSSELQNYGLLKEEADFISSRVPKVVYFSDFNDPAQLWNDRKKYFFKPCDSYGGRGAFRGSSISRKLFNDLFSRSYIAQEYIPPSTWNDMKWDLRFYVYKDEIQLVAARLYKGQTTNFQEPGSGLATVSFKQD